MTTDIKSTDKVKDTLIEAVGDSEWQVLKKLYRLMDTEAINLRFTVPGIKRMIDNVKQKQEGADVDNKE